MRLAAAILLLLSIALMAGAAYLGAGRWQLALYADVLAWTLTVLLVLAVGAENALKERGPWGRALVAALAAGAALAVSVQMKPGWLDPYPFKDLAGSATSVGALGCAVGALALGAASLRPNRRGPLLLGALSMFAAAFALRGWLRG